MDFIPGTSPQSSWRLPQALLCHKLLYDNPISDLANSLRWKFPTPDAVLPNCVCLVLKLGLEQCLLPKERVLSTRKLLKKTFIPCYHRDRWRAVWRPSCIDTIFPKHANGFASVWLLFDVRMSVSCSLFLVTDVVFLTSQTFALYSRNLHNIKVRSISHSGQRCVSLFRKREKRSRARLFLRA